LLCMFLVLVSSLLCCCFCDSPIFIAEEEIPKNEAKHFI